MTAATVQAATEVAKAVPVRISGGSSATGMVTSGGILTIVIMFAYALIKIAPKWRELGIGQRRSDMDAMREDIAELKREVRTLQNNLAHAERETAEVRMQMVTMNTANRLMASELEKLNPDNPVLKQAKELIRQAASDDFGWGEEGRKLAMMPGIVREQKAAGE